MQRFKPGQVYYNPVTKSTILVVDMPLVRRIASDRSPLTEFTVSPHFEGRAWRLIGNNYIITEFEADDLDRKQPEPGERYIHLKGLEYRVLVIAQEDYSGEKLVIHEGMHDGRVWSRPMSNFMGRKNGKMRFVQITEPEEGEQSMNEEAPTVPPKPLPVAYCEALDTIRQHEKTIEIQGGLLRDVLRHLDSPPNGRDAAKLYNRIYEALFAKK